jgi:hypothetical protein
MYLIKARFLILYNILYILYEKQDVDVHFVTLCSLKKNM